MKILPRIFFVSLREVTGLRLRVKKQFLWGACVMENLALNG